MISKPPFRSSTLLAATLALLAAIIALGASPARADRCDDLAAQLKSQIDGLKVGKTAANVIYLSHPLAKEITLGCAGRKFTPTNCTPRPTSASRHRHFSILSPAPAAIIFTLPKDDMLRGVSRCIGADGHFSRR